MYNAQSYDIYINNQSGTVLKLGTQGLGDILHRSGISVRDAHFCAPDGLIPLLEQRPAELETPVLIGGGDGTIRAAAAVMMAKGKPFGVLPLGTMNLMTRDLGVPVDLEEALSAYARGYVADTMDVAYVNDELYLCCAGLGTMPDSSKYREKFRDENGLILVSRMAGYVLEHLDPLHSKKLYLTMDGHKRALKTPALVVSNNQYKPAGEVSDNNFVRNSLRDGVMGVYSANPVSFWDKLRLLFQLGFGNWRRDRNLREWSCKDLEVRCKAKQVLVSVDGEPITLQTPLRFTIQRAALPILLPAVQKEEGEE